MNDIKLPITKVFAASLVLIMLVFARNQILAFSSVNFSQNNSPVPSSVDQPPPVNSANDSTIVPPAATLSVPPAIHRVNGGEDDTENQWGN